MFYFDRLPDLVQVRILEYVAYDVVLHWRGLNYPRYYPNFLDYLGVNWL
jgi:hypothetical protein